MNNWNKLLALLDKTLGFPNKIRSTVKKKGKGSIRGPVSTCSFESTASKSGREFSRRRNDL